MIQVKRVPWPTAATLTAPIAPPNLPTSQSLRPTRHPTSAASVNLLSRLLQVSFERGRDPNYGAGCSSRTPTPAAMSRPTCSCTESGCSATVRFDPPTRTLAPRPAAMDISADAPP